MLKSYVSVLFVLLRSKWLNLMKTLVLVKFAYFYAEIICFSTFCIIPVQMVKSAKNLCFSQSCIFLCQNHMFQHFLYYSSPNSQICWKPLFQSNLHIFMPKSYVSALFRQFHYIIFFVTDTNVHSLAKWTEIQIKNKIHRVYSQADTRGWGEDIRLLPNHIGLQWFYTLCSLPTWNIETYTNLLQILNPVYKVLSMMLIL